MNIKKQYLLSEISLLLENIDMIYKNDKNNINNYYIELKRERSLQQMRWYRGVLLEAIFNNLTESFLKRYNFINSLSILDTFLTEQFCLFKYGKQYFKEYTDINGNKTVVCIFSKSFDTCSQDLFNEYIDFIETKLYKMCNVSDIETLLYECGKPNFDRKKNNGGQK